MHNGHGQLPSAWDVRSTLEVMDDAAFIFDERATLVFLNRAAMRIFQLGSFEEAKRTLEGHPSAKVDVVGVTFAGKCKPGELVRRALAGEPSNAELERVIPCDGRPQLIIRITIRPIVSPSGAIIGALKLGRDVTFEYELSRLKEEFLRVTCHELRTPATILQLAAHRLLMSDTSPDEVRQRAQAIDRASRRIAALSMKLVDLAAISTGSTIALDLAETRLDAIVADAVASFNGEDKRVQLTTTPVAVRADGKRIKQVVEALVDNALRYSAAPAGIEVAVRAHDGTAEVSVADHGIGIPAPKQRHIFEQFYRAHTDTPFDRGGLGASLYLADHIMKAHGGRISFDSSEAGGSTFRIALAAAHH